MNVFVRSVLVFYTYLAMVVPTYHSVFMGPISSKSTRIIPRLPSPPPLLTPPLSPPLFLTPFIEAGKLEEARRLSNVVPFVDDVKSYAGFLTVNKTSESHLYFWFIPKTSVDNKTAPLILWLQGGPGYSALFGLFVENGPFEVSKNTLRRRSQAWTNNYHMLYVDQPVGTGFSFSETNAFVSTQEEVAEHLYETLAQFYTLFPEYKTHDLYIAGESYGGKYAPALGHKIHTINRERSHYCSLCDVHIPLKGLMIGNGFADPENMLEYGALLQGMGLIDRYERQELEMTQDKIKYFIQGGNWSQATSLRGQLLDDISKAINLTNLLDYTDDGGLDEVSFAEFLRMNQIRERIHVGNVEYVVNSQLVLHQFHDDIMRTVRPWIEELLEHYPMLFYNGEFDIRDSHQLTENYLNKLHWSGAINFGLARKQIWRNDYKVAGYYKRAKNLVYVMVRGAGHMAPAYQPKNVLNMIDMFINTKF